jgi:hypothetical protein
MNWKPGDRAILVDTGTDQDGEIVTVLEIGVSAIDLNTGKVWRNGVRIDIPPNPDTLRRRPGQKYAVVQPHQLKPLDDDDSATWDRVEELTGWHPQKVTA